MERNAQLYFSLLLIVFLIYCKESLCDVRNSDKMLI